MKRFSKSTKNPRRGCGVLEMGCEACQKEVVEIKKNG
nr:MAG TPA: hypothetical protein [Caudoviricetes sp.]